MKRENTRQIKVGSVAVGGGARVSVQSMCNTKTWDVDATVSQILAFEEAGCDIVRCAVPDMAAVKLIEKLKEMCGLLNTQYDLVKNIVLEEQTESAAKVDEYEDMIDNMRRALVSEHIDRLSQGKCRPENNAIFINLVSNLERIGDHLSFIVRN